MKKMIALLLASAFLVLLPLFSGAESGGGGGAADLPGRISGGEGLSTDSEQGTTVFSEYDRKGFPTDGVFDVYPGLELKIRGERVEPRGTVRAYVSEKGISQYCCVPFLQIVEAFGAAVSRQESPGGAVSYRIDYGGKTYILDTAKQALYDETVPSVNYLTMLSALFGAGLLWEQLPDDVMLNSKTTEYFLLDVMNAVVYLSEDFRCVNVDFVQVSSEYEPLLPRIPVSLSDRSAIVTMRNLSETKDPSLLAYAQSAGFPFVRVEEIAEWFEDMDGETIVYPVSARKFSSWKISQEFYQETDVRGRWSFADSTFTLRGAGQSAGASATFCTANATTVNTYWDVFQLDSPDYETQIDGYDVRIYLSDLGPASATGFAFRDGEQVLYFSLKDGTVQDYETIVNSLHFISFREYSADPLPSLYRPLFPSWFWFALGGGILILGGEGAAIAVLLHRRRKAKNP